MSTVRLMTGRASLSMMLMNELVARSTIITPGTEADPVTQIVSAPSYRASSATVNVKVPSL